MKLFRIELYKLSFSWNAAVTPNPKDLKLSDLYGLGHFKAGEYFVMAETDKDAERKLDEEFDRLLGANRVRPMFAWRRVTEMGFIS